MTQKTTPSFEIKAAARQPWMDSNAEEWYRLEEEARVNSLKRLYDGGSKVLIAIKAQHPLNPDGTPGPEYTARLQEAFALANRILTKNSHLAITFMTFGGVHAGHETMTLAEAGTNWLIQHAIAAERIITNRTVFAGNDEDDLAIQEFSNDTDYSELHIVMSAGQWDRTRFYCISTGWQPFLHPIVFLDDRPNHSSVCEFLGTYASSARSLVTGGLKNVRLATEDVRRRHRDELAAFKVSQQQ